MDGRLCCGCVRGGVLHGGPGLWDGMVEWCFSGWDEGGWLGVWFGMEGGVPGGELRERLGLGGIVLVLRRDNLQWYMHVLRKEDIDWVKKCIAYEAEGARPRGKTEKTWTEVVQKHCQARKLNREDAMDRSRWRKQIKDD